MKKYTVKHTQDQRYESSQILGALGKSGHYEYFIFAENDEGEFVHVASCLNLTEVEKVYRDELYFNWDDINYLISGIERKFYD